MRDAASFAKLVERVVLRVCPEGVYVVGAFLCRRSMSRYVYGVDAPAAASDDVAADDLRPAVLA